MSLKLSLAVLSVVWLAYVLFAGSFYANTWAMFN